MYFKQTKKILAAFSAIISIIGATALQKPVMAETLQVERSPLATTLNLPIYQWQDTERSPRSVVLAIHGLTMHGTVFDACARKLAADGAIVVAPDLRGYGFWYKDGKDTDINYEQSEKDVCALATAVRKRYKGLPVFVAGESLGGAMAIRLAAKHPQLIDGLILCSPAIKIYYPPKTIVEAALSLATHSHEFNTADYIKENFSEDPQITQEGIKDPLIRKQMSLGDLLESCWFIAATRHYISKIPSTMPVLVLQGEKDRIVNPDGITTLAANLKSADKTIDLLPQRGHILIETEHVHADNLKTIISWMDWHCLRYNQNHAVTAGSQLGIHDAITATKLTGLASKGS